MLPLLATACVKVEKGEGVVAVNVSNALSLGISDVCYKLVEKNAAGAVGFSQSICST